MLGNVPFSWLLLCRLTLTQAFGVSILSQCSIDLKKNVLVIGTTGSQTPFLPEGELPECARLAYGAGREDMRPEEIADQELAEALQKSVEEAGTIGSQIRNYLHSAISSMGGALSSVTKRLLIFTDLVH